MKHGFSNFVIETIDTTPQNVDELNALKCQYIAELSPDYNMTAGGDGDTSSSPNYRAAMARRDYSGKNNPNYDKRGKNSPK